MIRDLTRCLSPLLALLCLAGCSGAPRMPNEYRRLEISGEGVLGGVRGLELWSGVREVELSFKLPDGDYDYGVARLVDPKVLTSEGTIEFPSSGATVGSGTQTLVANVQFKGEAEFKGLESEVEILLCGPRNRVVVKDWDQLVGKVVDLPGLPGKLEVVEWSPEEARFRCHVPFPERVEMRVSDEHVAKGVVYSRRLVQEQVGEWRLKFSTPCPAGTGMTLSYPPEARRYTGRVKVGPLTFHDVRDQ